MSRPQGPAGCPPGKVDRRKRPGNRPAPVGRPAPGRRFLAGGRRAGPHPEPGDHRPDPLPPARRSGARSPAGTGRIAGPSPRSTCPGPAPCWPRGRAGSSARADDRGVVAVLDSRLATARYRGDLLARVPPMKRTVDRGRGGGLPPGHRHRRPTRLTAQTPAGREVGSETEPVEGVLAVLPPLLHPHEELEIGTRVHLAAHRGPHLFEGGPPLADDDALL